MAGRRAVLAVGLGASLALCAALVFMLGISRPRLIGFVPGSVVLQPETMGTEPVVVLRGSSPISMGQVQGVGVRFDGMRIVVEQYSILWHPLSELRCTHTEWPLVIRKRELPPGEYEVRYRASGGTYLSAGRFRVTNSETHLR